MPGNQQHMACVQSLDRSLLFRVMVSEMGRQSISASRDHIPSFSNAVGNDGRTGFRYQPLQHAQSIYIVLYGDCCDVQVCVKGTGGLAPEGDKPPADKTYFFHNVFCSDGIIICMTMYLPSPIGRVAWLSKSIAEMEMRVLWETTAWKKNICVCVTPFIICKSIFKGKNAVRQNKMLPSHKTHVCFYNSLFTSETIARSPCTGSYILWIHWHQDGCR